MRQTPSPHSSDVHGDLPNSSRTDIFRRALRRHLLSFEDRYLPFSQFKDCREGSTRQRDASFEHNKEHKEIILPYIGAWSLRGLAMAAALATAERAQAFGVDTAALQVGFGLGLVACVLVCVVMFVGWTGLTFFRR